VDAFRKDHPFGFAARHIHDATGEGAFIAHQLPQFVFIRFPVFYGLPGHTRFHGRLRHGHRNFGNQALVHRFGNEIRASERQSVQVVGCIDDIGYWFLGQVGDGQGGCHLHFFVDGGGSDIQRAPENIGKANDIVDLVGVVGAAGSHQNIGSGCHGLFIGNFRSGVGQGKHNGIGSHAAYHVLAEHVALGKTKENIRTLDGIFQCLQFGPFSSKEPLGRGQVGSAGRNHPLAVYHHHVFLFGTQGQVQLGAGAG
jgi:hypothetical protein